MFTAFSATERPKREYKLLKKLEGVRSRVGCVVRVDSYRATVDVINCGSPETSLNVHGLQRGFQQGQSRNGNRLFNSRCLHNNAEAVHSLYFVTAATCTCPHRNRREFVLADASAPRPPENSDADGTSLPSLR